MSQKLDMFKIEGLHKNLLTFKIFYKNPQKPIYVENWKARRILCLKLKGKTTLSQFRFVKLQASQRITYFALVYLILFFMTVGKPRFWKCSECLNIWRSSWMNPECLNLRSISSLVIHLVQVEGLYFSMF